MRSVRNPEFPQLSEIVSILRAIEWTSRAAHWRVQGNYGDHLLFERIYEIAEKGLDKLVERTIGEGTSFNEIQVGARAQALLTPVTNSTEAWAQKILELERLLDACISRFLRDKGQVVHAGGMPSGPSLGLENFLQDLLDKHSVVIYLLQQRLGSRAVANGVENMVTAGASAIATSGWVKPRKFGRGFSGKAAREAIPVLRDALARRDKKAFVRAWGQAALGGAGDTLFDQLVTGAVVIPALASGGFLGSAGATAGGAAGPGGAAVGGIAGTIGGATAGGTAGYTAIKPLLANPSPWAALNQLQRKNLRRVRDIGTRVAQAPWQVGQAAGRRATDLAERTAQVLRGKKGRRAVQNAGRAARVQDPNLWTREQVREKLLTDDRWVERAICAIARRQTRRELITKMTKHSNDVGFTGAHARVGSLLAEWMTMGQWGRHKRELSGTMQYKGTTMPRIEVARSIALHYVDQLTDLANMPGPAQSKRNPWG